MNVRLLILSLLSYARCSEKIQTKIETSEQLDPAAFYFRNYGPEMRPPTPPMLPVNFAFNCKCNSKVPNPSAPVPTDSNAAAQQQIQQLQEQVRRQQEVINRNNAGKAGIEQFAQLIQLANSLDCSCSSIDHPSNSMIYQQGLSGIGGHDIYRSFGGLTGLNNGMNGGVHGMSPIASLHGVPTLQGRMQTLQEIPFMA